VSRPGPAESLAGPLHDARTVQLAALELEVANGQRLVGYKTALIDPAAQQRLGAPGPVWGWFTDSMQLDDGATIDTASRHRLKVELELVFVLGADLAGPGVTEDDVLSATAGIRAGIELPGSRHEQAPATAAEFVADNTAASWFVLGAERVSPAGVDLTALSAHLSCDGEVVATGSGARVMGNPARAVAILVDTLALSGRTLRAGQFVFTGALASPLSPSAGHTYLAEFDHLGTLGFSTA
jgi:2-oxo-3-hexenedioate decarboxylase